MSDRAPRELPELDQLRFQVFELVTWGAARRIGSWSPADPRTQADRGPAESLTLEFGELSADGPWWHVRSGLPDAMTSEQRARSQLAFALVADAAARGVDAADEPWTLSRDAAAADLALEVDGAARTFRAVAARGVAAAAAEVSGTAVVLFGRGDPGGLALRTLVP